MAAACRAHGPRIIEKDKSMQIENTSGQGKLAVVPPQIDRWNWGAFLLNWIWGIGNNTFIALLMFVPFVNVVMAFILGVKGSTWAWRNKRWASVEEFQAVQRKWTKWALIVYALMVCAFVAMFFAVGAMLKDSEPYKLAQAELIQNSQVQAALGQPISLGTPSGSIEVSGPNGAAHFEFSVSGPKGSGTAYVEARKSLGRWELTGMAVDDSATGNRMSIK